MPVEKYRLTGSSHDPADAIGAKGITEEYPDYMDGPLCQYMLAHAEKLFGAKSTGLPDSLPSTSGRVKHEYEIDTNGDGKIIRLPDQSFLALSSLSKRKGLFQAIATTAYSK